MADLANFNPTDLIRLRRDLLNLRKGKLERSQEVLIKQIQLKYGITENEKDFIRTVTDLDKLDLAIEKILTNISKEELLSILK